MNICIFVLGRQILVIYYIIPMKGEHFLDGNLVEFRYFHKKFIFDENVISKNNIFIRSLSLAFITVHVIDS